MAAGACAGVEHRGETLAVMESCDVVENGIAAGPVLAPVAREFGLEDLWRERRKGRVVRLPQTAGRHMGQSRVPVNFAAWGELTSCDSSDFGRGPPLRNPQNALEASPFSLRKKRRQCLVLFPSVWRASWCAIRGHLCE